MAPLIPSNPDLTPKNPSSQPFISDPRQQNGAEHETTEDMVNEHGRAALKRTDKQTDHLDSEVSVITGQSSSALADATERMEAAKARVMALKSNFTIYDDELPTPEKLVHDVIQYEKEQVKRDFENVQKENELRGNRFKQRGPKKEEYWIEREKNYLQHEKLIRELLRQRSPELDMLKWGPAGPLSYALSPRQMQLAIHAKFKEMISQGKLRRASSLVKTSEDRKHFYPRPEEMRKTDNLTRIWGAEYLESKMRASMQMSDWKAAEYYLVIDDDAEEVEVCVSEGPSPFPALAGMSHAEVLSKIVIGEPCAQDSRASLRWLKYSDFSANDNVRKDEKGTKWVLDTELKSFDAPALEDYSTLVDYIKNRFHLLSGSNNGLHTFKIRLADIGLT